LNVDLLELSCEGNLLQFVAQWLKEKEESDDGELGADQAIEEGGPAQQGFLSGEEVCRGQFAVLHVLDGAVELFVEKPAQRQAEAAA